MIFQKRKTLRACSAPQRRIKSNGVNEAVTISHVVDKCQRIGQISGPEIGWSGDTDTRQRRTEEGGGVQPVPRYMPGYTGYTWDVSHLVVN